MLLYVCVTNPSSTWTFPSKYDAQASWPSSIPCSVSSLTITATFNEPSMMLMMVDSSRFRFLKFFFPGLVLNIFCGFLIPFMYIWHWTSFRLFKLSKVQSFIIFWTRYACVMKTTLISPFFSWFNVLLLSIAILLIRFDYKLPPSPSKII